MDINEQKMEEQIQNDDAKADNIDSIHNKQNNTEKNKVHLITPNEKPKLKSKYNNSKLNSTQKESMNVKEMKRERLLKETYCDENSSDDTNHTNSMFDSPISVCTNVSEIELRYYFYFCVRNHFFCMCLIFFW